MKKYARKISLFVAISILATMIMGSLGVSAQESGSILTQNQEGLLRYLEILPEEEPGYSEEITRGELAHLAARVANAPAYTGEELYFYDVSREHPYFADIYALGAMGVISGDGNGYFRPEDTVSDLEICKIFSVILGYKEAGEFVSYLRIARDAEITEGVNMDGVVTYGEAIAMAYNTLHGDMFEAITYGETKEYKKKKGYLAIERYHGLVMQSGIVEGMQYTTLFEPSIDIPEGHIKINNRVFKWEDETLLGKFVIFYSEREGDSTAKEIEYIYADETRNHIVSLRGEDVIGIEDGKLNYWVGSNKRSYKIVSTRDIIVNGVAHPKATIADLQPASGSVTLIDNNDDTIYDVIVVESYEYAVFEMQEKETGVIYTKYPEGSVGSREQTNDISLIGPYGKVNINSVVKGTVLRIQSSKNTIGTQKIRLIQMVGDVTGTVTAVQDDRIVVGDKEYVVNRATIVDEPVSLGQTVTVYSDGNLAGVILHASNDNYQFGYLVGASNFGSVFNGKLTVRVVDKNYILQEYDAADTIFVDEIKHTKVDAILARLKTATSMRSYHEDVGLGSADTTTGLNDLGRMEQGDGKFPYSQPVRFKLNDEGKLTHLDTMIYEQDYELTDSLQMGEEGKSEVRRLLFAPQPNSFYDSGSELVYTAESLEQMIRIQQVDRDDTKGFRGTLANGVYLVVEAFNIDPVTKIAKYLVLYDAVAKKPEESSTAYIVSDIYAALDENGVPAQKVDLIHPSSSRTVILPSDLQFDLAIGDVIQIVVNGENVLQSVTMMFDQSLGKDQKRVIGKEGSYHPLYVSPRVSYGTLVNFTGSIYTHTTSVKADNDGVKAYNQLHNIKHDNNTIIYVYEEINGKPNVKQGSTRDIITYNTDPNTNQTAVICTRYGYMDYVLLIKEG